MVGMGGDPEAVMRRSILIAISLEFAFDDLSERDALPKLTVVEQDNSQVKHIRQITHEKE